MSSNQIVDVNVEFNCIEPDCTDLNGVLKAIDKSICDLSKPEGLDFKCLDSKEKLQEILQVLIDGICTSENNGGGGGNSGGGTTIPLSLNFNTLNFCNPDLWTCSSTSNCLVVSNPCDPSTITFQVFVQSLISRLISLSIQSKKQCEDISDLKNRIATLESQFTVIQNNCCN